MKTNIRFKRDKKVYYFEYKKGVLHKRRRIAEARQLLAGVFSLGLVISFGFYANQYYQSSQTKAAYLQVKKASAAQKPSEDKSKLQKASTQAQEDDALKGAINDKLKEMPDGQEYSIYVRDLKSNRMANIKADKSHESASLYKLFLLAPLETKLAAKSWRYKMNRQSFESCVEAMISVSDNYCGQAIGQYVGWQYADQVNESLGFNGTKLNDSKKQKTTARDVGELMYRLQNSQLLSDKARRVLFDALYKQKHRDGIPAACTEDCLIANKTGESVGSHHDAAIVTNGHAKYVVVIMSKNASWQNVAEVQEAIDSAMQP